MPYHHISFDERYCIAGLLWLGHSLRGIAKILGRSASTISREVSRNRSPVLGSYSPVSAQRRYEARQQWVRAWAKSRSEPLLEAVVGGLESGWSPEQISCRLRLEHPEAPQWRISHQTIYRMVAKNQQLRGQLRRAGRRKRKRYGSGPDRRGRLPGCKPISDRPPVVQRRARAGDWEGDSMQDGKGKAVVMAFVERKTGYFLASKHATRNAQAMLSAASRAFSCLPQHLVQTLTLDNGKENACHEELEKSLGLPVYFADPGCAWQRGTCENTLGLLRQYIPKRFDISKVTEKQLQGYVTALNNRPRKRLGYRTPNEAFWDACCCT